MKQETIIHIVHMEGKPHGGEIYAMNCAIGQKTMGHNVIFIYSISSHDFYYRELESYGIKTFGMQLRKEFRKSISTIRTLINEECVTIIHSHNFIPNIIGTIAKFGIPETLHIITIHGVLKHYWNPGFSRIRMYWILFVVYRMADLVISVSDAAKNDMMSYFHLSAQKIFTLKNAISVQRIMKNSSYTISKDSIGISAEMKVLLCVGSIDSRKRQLDIINAIGNYLKDLPIVLLLIGDGDQRSRCAEAAIAHGIADRIIFEGYKENVFDYYSISDMFILASSAEGLPGVVMEAMYFSLPVIVSDIENNKEIVIDKSNGLLFKMGDEKSLADAIRLIVSDSTLSSNIALNGKRDFQEKYEFSIMLSKLMELITTIQH